MRISSPSDGSVRVRCGEGYAIEGAVPKVVGTYAILIEMPDWGIDWQQVFRCLTSGTVTGDMVYCSSLSNLGMTQYRLMAALVAAVVLLAWSASGAASSPVEPSFVGVTPNAVVFIQWTESRGGYLTGQIQIASVTTPGQGLLADLLSWLGIYDPDSDRLRIETHNVPFTGVRNGQGVSITFSQLLVTKTLTGTLKGSTLTLTVPRDDGLLSTFVMRTGTGNEYNRAVIALQKRIAHLNDLASQREAVIQAARVFGTAHSRLSDDLDRLERVTDFAGIFEDYRKTWIKMQRDHATLRTDAAKQPLDCYQLGTVKYDLGTLEYDMGTIQYHNATFDSIRRNVLDAVHAVRDNVASMQRALQELQRAVKADSTKTASQQDVDRLKERFQRAEKTAVEQVRRASATLQQAENEARSYNEKAKGLLSEARQYVASLSCTE